MKKLLTLTALLIANSPALRGEGENTDPPRFSEQEWEQRRAAELAKTNQTELVKMVVAAEVENRGLKRNQVPKGARVLTKEEADAYDAYVALGKPDELKTKLDDGEKAATTLADRDKADAVRTAAEASGYKQTVLGDRLKADGLTEVPTVREVERDGKKVQVAYVKDAQGAEHELTEYAKKNWGDYLPALQVQASTTTNSGGTEFTQQDATSTTAGGGGSWVKDILKTSSEGGGYKDPLQAPAATAK